MSSIFFALVGLILASAASFQFYIAYEIESTCQYDLNLVPLVSGSCLLGAFAFNALWVFNLISKRVSICIWSILLMMGAIAAGATLGQVQLYTEMDCDIESPFDFNGLCIASIVLIIVSIASPHTFKGGKTPPINPKKMKPLIFF